MHTHTHTLLGLCKVTLSKLIPKLVTTEEATGAGDYGNVANCGDYSKFYTNGRPKSLQTYFLCLGYRASNVSTEAIYFFLESLTRVLFFCPRSIPAQYTFPAVL